MLKHENILIDQFLLKGTKKIGKIVDQYFWTCGMCTIRWNKMRIVGGTLFKVVMLNGTRSMEVVETQS